MTGDTRAFRVLVRNELFRRAGLSAPDEAGEAVLAVTDVGQRG